MRKNKLNKGFTLAEVLIVVALIGVLSGVAFISVVSYLRSMIQLERDGIAKEIFVAAQNHLTMVEHEGYLNQSNYGHLETSGETSTENQNSTEDPDSIYYFVVNNGVDSAGSEVLKLMLPFGSIDETVRLGGSYIIRYQKDPGLILDVFYCTENGRFPHAFQAGEYDTVKALAGEEQKSNRRNCSDLGQSVIGWYGGVAARDLTRGTELKAPVVEVVNEDELYVRITNTNGDNGTIKLIIQGEKSRAQGAVLLETDNNWIKPDPDDSNSVIVILDDITNANNKFSNLSKRLEGNIQGTFIPGENITIQAVAYDNSSITNIAYSAIKTTNSLYRDVVKSEDRNTAYITSLRHLENLDSSVSNLGKSITISAAAQKTDLSWKSFLNNIKELNQIGSTESDPSVKYTGSKGAAFSTEPKTYKPIVLTPAMVYDGESHTISDVVIDIKAEREINHAGLIETLENGTISNLMLKDFSVTTQTGDAGALAGTLTGDKTEVKNVVVRNSTGAGSGSPSGGESGTGSSAAAQATGVSGTANAGGLIGSMTGGSVTGCAAAVTVNGSTAAGGLIGDASSTAITASYAGGHTKEGAYSKSSADVTGSIAGGFIGKADSSITITACYTTCSVSGSIAGGFAGNAGFDGNASGTAVKNSYCTGLVTPADPEAQTVFAFLGAGSISGSGNQFYEIINEMPLSSDESGNSEKEISYMPAGTNAVSAFDLDAETYNAFAGVTTAEAKPYDPILTSYYGKTYFLKSVTDLLKDAGSTDTGIGTNDFVNTHYGDWPAPEIFVINTGTSSGSSGNGNGETAGG